MPGTFRETIRSDLTAGVVVFLVALPLCLGIAMASDAPAFSGLLAGIVGGLIVAAISGSHTSVSGPAAGLTTIVAAQIATLGFELFLTALMLAGFIQIALGIARAGFLSAFFPSSVIKGLLAAIGLILILKQIPHVLGHDSDPEGDMAFFQPDKRNTFSEFAAMLPAVHRSAAIIGFASLALLVLWNNVTRLKRLPIPVSLVVVVLGLAANWGLSRLGGPWVIGASHLVNVPVADSLRGVTKFLEQPDFTHFHEARLWIAAGTIAMVASLETLLNVEAVDKLDPWQRATPMSRELIAQGVGNVVLGCIGGIPVTSVIVRSSVNINSGGRTKMAAIVHGILLVVCVLFLPQVLNRIPLSCLAAILLVTGAKLFNPKLFRQMWKGGKYQFLPFVITITAIVLTNLLAGVVIGLCVGISFILFSTMKRPIQSFYEEHFGTTVTRIQLANQVSFLNRGALDTALNRIPRNGHVLIDGRLVEYIDPDILDMLHDYREVLAPARRVNASFIGFPPSLQLPDQILYSDYATREVQERLTPNDALQILKSGHERFQRGSHLTRDTGRQISGTAAGQFPIAVVLSCIDSRTSAELIFDCGVGDVFSVRIAGNVTSQKVLGSIEYGCTVARAKLVVVMGHTRCGAVTAAVDFATAKESAAAKTGCQHLDFIVSDIQRSLRSDDAATRFETSPDEHIRFVDEVASRNVQLVVSDILAQSKSLRQLSQSNQIRIVGCLYDVTSATIHWFE